MFALFLMIALASIIIGFWSYQNAYNALYDALKHTGKSALDVKFMMNEFIWTMKLPSRVLFSYVLSLWMGVSFSLSTCIVLIEINSANQHNGVFVLFLAMAFLASAYAAIRATLRYQNITKQKIQ